MVGKQSRGSSGACYRIILGALDEGIVRVGKCSNIDPREVFKDVSDVCRVWVVVNHLFYVCHIWMSHRLVLKGVVVVIFSVSAWGTMG